MSASHRIRDRFWLFGMKANALQEHSDFSPHAHHFSKSTLTLEDAIQRTGISNVLRGGGLPITRESFDEAPSQRRIICKWQLHHAVEDRDHVITYDECLSRLLATKELASQDTRIEGFHVDDFSTGSVTAGITPEHLARFLFDNAINPPRLPIGATIYTKSLDHPKLPALLPYFDQFLFPFWDADEVDAVPNSLARFSDLSGDKPVMLCLYVFDFGAYRQMSRETMQRQLDMAVELLHQERISDVCICGTCLMDQDWESNRCLYEWLDKMGDEKVSSTGESDEKGLHFDLANSIQSKLNGQSIMRGNTQ